jgi:hypothetical protein
MMAGLLGALAAVQASRAAALASPASSPRPATQAGAFLPIGFTYVVVGYVAIDAWIQKSVDPFGLGIAIALTLLCAAGRRRRPVGDAAVRGVGGGPPISPSSVRRTGIHSAIHPSMRLRRNPDHASNFTLPVSFPGVRPGTGVDCPTDGWSGEGDVSSDGRIASLPG